MTYNTYSTALQTIRLAFRFLLALPLVAAIASPLACVFDTVLSALRRLSADDMGLDYSPVLFDDDQDSVEWTCGVVGEKTAGLVPDSLSARSEGELSGVSVDEPKRRIPAITPFERLILEAIDSGSVGIHLPTTMEEVREQRPNEPNRGTLRMFTGAKYKRSVGIPAHRDTSLVEAARFASFDRPGAVAFDWEGEVARPVKNNWLKKT
ncbi:hypothetical protein CLU79DRAFT_772072 [Phycomyces nitens]|nr:hypothetical protein CLU79DRAFT_772072 [Phycomyces nitens]